MIPDSPHPRGLQHRARVSELTQGKSFGVQVFKAVLSSRTAYRVGSEEAVSQLRLLSNSLWQEFLKTRSREVPCWPIVTSTMEGHCILSEWVDACPAPSSLSMALCRLSLFRLHPLLSDGPLSSVWTCCHLPDALPCPPECLQPHGCILLPLCPA